MARRIGFHAIAVLGTLCAVELVWRLAVPVTAAERQSAEFLATSRRFLERCADTSADPAAPMLVGRQVHKTGGAFRVPLEKRAGAIRIVFLGESTGVMLAGAAHDLLAHAAAQRANAIAGTAGAAAAVRATAEGGVAERFELLNCAESGSALGHVERRAREVLAYDADVVVIVFGHNWMMPPYPMDERALRLRALFARSRLVAGLAHALGQPPPPDPPLDAAGRAARVARLEAFLREFADAARARGTTVVVATLAANHRFPPLRTVEAAAEPRLLEATLAHARGDTASAVAALERLVAGRAEPHWHFVLGSWLSRRGETAAAASHLQAAIDVQWLEVDRATTAINDAIRRVAADEGLLLRDTDAELRRRSGTGVLGWDVMRDHCHPLPAIVREEAAALLALSARAADATPPPIDAAAWRDDGAVAYVLDGLATIQGQLVDERAERYRAAISHFVEHWMRADPQPTREVIARFLDGPVLTGMGADSRSAVLVALADGLAWAGACDDARAMNERALGDAQAAAWVQLGLRRVAEASVRAGTAAGDCAVSTMPQSSDAAGEGRDAAAAFARALAIAPDRADAAYFLGRVAAATPDARGEASSTHPLVDASSGDAR